MVESDYEKMSEFSCGDEELDLFFRYEVKKCVSHHYLAAYCAFADDCLIGAFTLMNDALMIVGETEKSEFIDDLKLETAADTVDFFMLQTSYPAINIGHLGISKQWQNKGIGTAILDLIATTYSQFRQSGCQFVTVDAINNRQTLKFYTCNGFSFQTNKDFYSATRRMYRTLWK